MANMLPIQAFRDVVARAGRVLLTGPADPDGDSIGSCLALARLLKRISKAHIDVAGVPVARYVDLPGARGMIPDERVVGPYDVAVVLDGDQRRLGVGLAPVFRDAQARILIDHHCSTSPQDYDLALLDTAAASTCEIIFRLIEAWDLPLDEDLATLLYAGMVFDTGGFRHSNTTPQTHRIAGALLSTGINHSALSTRILAERSPAALWLMGRVLANARFEEDGAMVVGAIPLAVSRELGTSHADAEGIVDMLVYASGVEAAILAVERAPAVVKLSLRSRGRINVASIARGLDPGGGGHARAAGVILEQPLERVLERICEAVGTAVRAIPS